MTVRQAGPGDAAAIAEIWNHYIRNTAVTFTPTEKRVAEVRALLDARAAEGHATFVSTGETGVLGFAGYARFRAGEGYRRTLEHTVLVAPGATGAGRGRALLTAVMDHARAGGGHSIFAGISSGNPEGLAFHAAMGFAPEAILREAGWKNGKWWDLHLMRAWL